TTSSTPRRGFTTRRISSPPRSSPGGGRNDMVLRAITRSPGPELARCELTHLGRLPIDIGRARSQHRADRDALDGAGIRVVELPSDPALPDGAFVEDTAVVLDELAVITAPAPASRRGEWPAVEAALRPFRRTVRLPAGAYLEGGDVVRLGRTLYVGQGGRTGEAGGGGRGERGGAPRCPGGPGRPGGGPPPHSGWRCPGGARR